MASNAALREQTTRLEDLMTKLNQGVGYFTEHHEEAVGYISTELDYSKEDAREWLKTVEFAGDVRGVRGSVVEETVKVLRKAGVVGDVDAQGMIGIKKPE